MAAKTTGLFRRGSSFYVRILLPAKHPLRLRYTSGRVVQSLGACDHREAARRALTKRAALLTSTASPAVQGIDLHLRQSAQGASAKHSDTPRMRDVYARWAKASRRSDDTLAACERALRLYEQQTGSPPIGMLTREQGDAFRAWLLAQETSTKTARDRFTWVKSLLKFAQQDLGALPQNPWTGLDIATRPATLRRPWTDRELELLFSHEIWAKGRLPSMPKAGGAAAYWLPLLALYTGARCSELCQLHVANVRIDVDIPTLHLTDTAVGQRLKTEATRRIIPVHSELIRLGFLDYVNQHTAGTLWPHLPQREHKPGGYFSAYFTSLRQSLGFGPQTVFHSLRHTVRSQLAEKGVAEPLIDRLLGHEMSGSIGARVYTHIGKSHLHRAVEQLRYSATTGLVQVELIRRPRTDEPDRVASDVQMRHDAT